VGVLPRPPEAEFDRERDVRAAAAAAAACFVGEEEEEWYDEEV